MMFTETILYEADYRVVTVFTSYICWQDIWTLAENKNKVLSVGSTGVHPYAFSEN